MVHKERRRHTRKRVDLEVSYRAAGGERVVAHANDMSMGGMFVRTAPVPAFGSTVELEFLVPGHATAIVLAAVVRWTTPDGMGVQFQLLGARDTYAITEHLATCEPIPET
ncbi:MAG: PilZ domain-containing protein [Polyangiaceae bacterium]|nr:PilZ domain-containing protein [Polyangiaceae bacterium]